MTGPRQQRVDARQWVVCEGFSEASSAAALGSAAYPFPHVTKQGTAPRETVSTECHGQDCRMHFEPPSDLTAVLTKSSSQELENSWEYESFQLSSTF